MIWIALFIAAAVLVGFVARRQPGARPAVRQDPPTPEPLGTPRQWQPVRPTGDPDLWMLGTAAALLAEEEARRQGRDAAYSGDGTGWAAGTSAEDVGADDSFVPGGGSSGGAGATGDWSDSGSDGGGGGDGGGD